MNLHGWHVMAEKMRPAFSTFPPSMAVILVPYTNSRRFRRIISASALASCFALPPASLQSYIHAGNVAGAWMRKSDVLHEYCNT